MWYLNRDLAILSSKDYFCERALRVKRLVYIVLLNTSSIFVYDEYENNNSQRTEVMLYLSSYYERLILKMISIYSQYFSFPLMRGRLLRNNCY